MKANGFYHVVPVPGGWAVKREGAARASRVFAQKSDAVRYGVDVATHRNRELVIHDRDGRILETSEHPTGYGSLRGTFQVREGIDLTKPIYEQVLALDRKS